VYDVTIRALNFLKICELHMDVHVEVRRREEEEEGEKGSSLCMVIMALI